MGCRTAAAYNKHKNDAHRSDTCLVLTTVKSRLNVNTFIIERVFTPDNTANNLPSLARGLRLDEGGDRSNGKITGPRIMWNSRRTTLEDNDQLIS
jgi:hypothetical protein